VLAILFGRPIVVKTAISWRIDGQSDRRSMTRRPIVSAELAKCEVIQIPFLNGGEKVITSPRAKFSRVFQPGTIKSENFQVVRDFRFLHQPLSLDRDLHCVFQGVKRDNVLAMPSVNESPIISLL
jgi:hypothetical protein